MLLTCSSEKPVNSSIIKPKLKKITQYSELISMRKTFRKISTTKLSIYNEEKIWKSFLLTFSKDLPFTKEDNRMLENVKNNLHILARKKIYTENITPKVISFSQYKTTNSKEKINNIKIKSVKKTILVPKFKLTYQIENNWKTQEIENNKKQYIVAHTNGNGAIYFLFAKKKIYNIEKNMMKIMQMEHELISRQKQKIGPFMGKLATYRIKINGVQSIMKIFIGKYFKKSTLIYYMCPKSDRYFKKKVENSLHSIRRL